MLRLAASVVGSAPCAISPDTVGRFTTTLGTIGYGCVAWVRWSEPSEKKVVPFGPDSELNVASMATVRVLPDPPSVTVAACWTSLAR